jgi:hypothetical protein
VKTKHTPSPRPAKKLPKARVCFASREVIENPAIEHRMAHHISCALVPFATPAEARAFARFWGMPEESRIHKLAAHFYGWDSGGHGKYERTEDFEYWRKKARAVLARLAPNRRTKSEG